MSYVMWCKTHDAQIIGTKFNVDAESADDWCWQYICWKYDHQESDHGEEPTPCLMVEGDLVLPN